MTPADREAADRLVAAAPPLPPEVLERIDVTFGELVRDARRDLLARRDQAAAS